MDATAADALLATLRPWIYLLIRRNTSCALKHPARTEFGVVFTFEVKIDHSNNVQDAYAALVKLREAIDLVYRLLAVHTELAMRLHDVDDGIMTMKGTALDAVVIRVLCLNAPFEMHVSILVRQLENAATLKRALGETFLVGLSQVPSLDGAYLAARAKLDAILQQKNPRWIDALARNPIEVKCLIKTTDRLELLKKPEAERFFHHLADFMGVLDKYETPSPQPTSHLPVHFEIGSFHLSPTFITPGIAKIAMTISRMHRARLKCKTVGIHPRLIACSREDFAVYLKAITTSVVAEGASVELLPLNLSLPVSGLADDEVGVTQLIPDLIATIVQRDTISSLCIGGLLDDSNTPQSRCVIYQALLDYVLVREPPIELRFAHGRVSALDAQLLDALVQRWRLENPGAKLRLKRVVLKLFDDGNAFSHAFMAALDEVEDVTINNEDDRAPAISRNQIAIILKKFDVLRGLSLDHIDLETMDVFMTEAPPTLESIVLYGLRLTDRNSFLDFIDSLGNPELPLAKHLRHLRISDHGYLGRSMMFRTRLSELEAEHFANTMLHNRTLETLDVCIDDVGYLDMSCPLEVAVDSVIPAALNVRRSSQERARRVAFLSVLNLMQEESQANQWPALDSFLVRQIFEFDHPSVLRSIMVRQKF